MTRSSLRTPMLGVLARLFVGRFAPPVTAAILLAGLFVFGGLRFQHFATPSNALSLFAEYSFVGIAAIGATFVIVSGGIDLSVGAVVACTSVLIAWLVERHEVHPITASAIALAAGTLFGGGMGAMIERYALPPFLVTLAGMFVARGLAFWIEPRSISVHHAFYDWASQHAVLRVGELAIPLRTSVFVVALVAALIVGHRTAFGRTIYAIGGNDRSARRMGLPVAATRIGTYALAGACSALAGVVFTMYKQAGDPASAVGLELDVIAAAVIGGTLLSGGVGFLIGTTIGVLLLGTIRSLIDYQGTLSSAWTSIAVGALLLGFVALQHAVAALARHATGRPQGDSA
jgi:galactofuranose transport system permease protein